MNCPVVFIVFNRPEKTARVFAEIAKAKPSTLFVIADGPRLAHPDEVGKCSAVRAIIDTVDWDCDVHINYSDVNLGCKRRVSTGLDWVFSMVEMAIILEDDCLPDPTFFRFCAELLERYKYDTRIAMISGDDFNFGNKRTEDSYHFSQLAHIWGWATWKRVWDKFDVDMKLWPDVRDANLLKHKITVRAACKHWTTELDKTYNGTIDTWDYQFAFMCFIENQLSIVPNNNLVCNIGFGTDATHTKTPNKNLELKSSSLQFPLLHPQYIMADVDSDHSELKKQFSELAIIKKLIRRLK